MDQKNRKDEEKENEISYKNNTKNFYVEVLDSRNKVLLLSTAPHPDISALKNVLSTDDKIEFESALFKDWEGNVNQANLLICHSPQKTTDLNTIQRFEQENIPILYILGLSFSCRGCGASLEQEQNRTQLGSEFRPSTFGRELPFAWSEVE